MVLVVVLIRSGSRVLKTWFGCQVAEQGTLLDLFNDFSAGKIDNTFPLSDTFSTASIECEIGRDKRVLTEFVCISLDVSVGEAVSTLGNYIEYNVCAQEDLSPSLPVSVLPNAFTILMQGARNRTVLPDKWNNTNAKFKLKNDIIDWLAKNELGWEVESAKRVGQMFVNTLGDALWYIDGNAKTLRDRSLGIPTQLEQFQGYKEPEKHKHRITTVDSMKADSLLTHSTALFNLTASSYMKLNRWKSVREMLLRLADNLRKYSSYLNTHTKAHQSTKEIASDTDEINILVATDVPTSCNSQYHHLHQALKESMEFKAVFINDYAPPDAKQRYHYLKKLSVPCKSVKYTYTGSKSHLHFLWKVDDDSSESEILSKSLKICDELKSSIPVYHSKAAKREFVHLFGKLTMIKPAILREIYHRLTGDYSGSTNLAEKEVD